jgi:hypothetical protein
MNLIVFPFASTSTGTPIPAGPRKTIRPKVRSISAGDITQMVGRTITIQPTSPTCRWIIDGRPHVECGQPATHHCPHSDSFYCRDHVEDFERLFGIHSLREFTMEESQP